MLKATKFAKAKFAILCAVMPAPHSFTMWAHSVWHCPAVLAPVVLSQMQESSHTPIQTLLTHRSHTERW